MRRRLLPPWSLFLFLLGLLAVAAAGGSQATVSPAVAADFVRRSCRSTSYPRVCESTLVPRAPAVGRSPRRLARAALLVGADRAASWYSYLRGAGVGGGGSGAMQDCLEMAGIAEQQLRRSAAETERMGRAGSPRFAWRLGNVQTWASAALTDASTCLDSLDADRDRRKGKAAADKDDAVRRRAVAVAQATSNALALVNKLQLPTTRRRL